MISLTEVSEIPFSETESRTASISAWRFCSRFCSRFPGIGSLFFCQLKLAQAHMRFGQIQQVLARLHHGTDRTGIPAQMDGRPFFSTKQLTESPRRGHLSMDDCPFFEKCQSPARCRKP
jgi:hypothetical protein